MKNPWKGPRQLPVTGGFAVERPLSANKNTGGGGILRRLGFRRRHLGLPLIRPLIRPFTKAGLIKHGFVAGAEVRTSFFVRVGDKHFQYALNPRDSIGSVLYWYSWRAWDSAVVIVFSRWMRGARRIVDLGANTGFFTLLGAANGSDVVAFEPNPATFQQLGRNVRLNHFESRCTLLQLAAGSKAEEVLFYLHDDSTCCSAVRPAANSTTVQMARVDAVIPLDQRTDLVKVDVEGFEDHVLLGLEGIIRDSHPRIIFECFRKATAPVVETLLKDNGYRLNWITPEGSTAPVDRLNVSEYGHGHHNFAAVF